MEKTVLLWIIVQMYYTNHGNCSHLIDLKKKGSFKKLCVSERKTEDKKNKVGFLWRICRE